eukprot:7391765-Prymnesium_polylepis.4
MLLKALTRKLKPLDMVEHERGRRARQEREAAAALLSHACRGHHPVRDLILTFTHRSRVPR